ncbi:3-oxoacyl-[acyl-carrier-protein] synthase III C-terminal domain-containing protein [Streptomyces sp. NPDC004435]|uniref:3-oxoacyl-[acyl-carrier-protein] synthase III C-terminal domain-containing protein n=1 Tax=Streptomyces sp. NPDC004435 TaxID=3364701 RepID=UPI0036C7EA75
MDVYITASSSYLPGNPVGNDEMEARLGLVSNRPSPLKATILRQNKIRNRHYAIDEQGNQTHLNEELAAHAVDALLRERGIPLNRAGILTAGTTVPDLALPGFASMVHGKLAELGHKAPLEILSAAGGCTSGAMALRHALNAVRCGAHRRAIACASELTSPLMRGHRFDGENERAPLRTDTPEGFHYFNAEFLRWMLSDGAGAVLLEDTPAADRPSLRVDWVELTSYAHMLPTCMSIGTSNAKAPAVGNTLWSVPTVAEAEAEGMLLLRQDTKLLAQYVVELIGQEIERLIKTGRIEATDTYDWYLPHISSYFFLEPIAKRMAQTDLDLPVSRWFTNLERVGNIGSAALYVMLDEALRTEVIQPGQRILAMVPESARFAYSFAQFTCVPPA